MIPSLNDLRLVEIERLILHEAHDARRLAHLKTRLTDEGIQRNPVIVAPRKESYLVLDGAHRAHSIREAGCRFILVQLVEPPSAAESWGHLLPNLSISKLWSLDGIELSESPDEPWIARVSTSTGERAYLCAKERGLAEEVRALWSIQGLYPNEDVVRRVDPDSPARLGEDEFLINYRAFTVDELVEIVRCGAVLPAGITRFRVPERVLGVRFPLESLRGGDLDERNAELRNFVTEHWRQNRVRYYGEPVVLFE